MSIRVGSIGFGRHFRRSLLPNVIATESLSLVAVAELDPATRALAADRLPGLPLADSGAALLERDDLDAVIISAHPEAHAQLTKAALQAGKHVFVEKPVALAADPVCELADLAARHERVVMTGTMWRHAPVHQTMRRWMTRAGVQPVTFAVNATFPAVLLRPGWDLDEVALAVYDMFIHPIDWASWLLGPVCGVDAIRQELPGTGAMTAQIRLVSEDSMIGVLTLATGSRAYQVDAWIQTDAGDLIEIDTKERLRVTTSPTWSATEGGIRDRATENWEAGQLYRGWGRKGYAEELAVWAERIGRNTDHRLGLDEAAETMRIIEQVVPMLRDPSRTVTAGQRQTA